MNSIIDLEIHKIYRFDANTIVESSFDKFHDLKCDYYYYITSKIYFDSLVVQYPLV